MRVDADDFARPCSCGREHQIAGERDLIEAGAVEKLEEEMSEGMLERVHIPAGHLRYQYLCSNRRTYGGYL